MSTNESSPAPIAAFRDAVAERAKVTKPTVDLILADIGIVDEKPIRRADNLTVRSLSFSGTKAGTDIQDGPYNFAWNELESGLWGILSENDNQIGKSTIVEVMLWALRGRVRSLKPEVRAWISEVEIEFTVGPERYNVSFTDFDGVPRGKLVMLAPGPARVIDTFDSNEAFEQLMSALMMARFALQPIPTVNHVSEEASQYQHSWTAYVASMFIEGSHPAILGDVTVGALWWRMLHLFVGVPYAATHMALRTALTIQQGTKEQTSSARAVQNNYASEIAKLEKERKRVESDFKELNPILATSSELDSLALDNARLTRELTELAVDAARINASAIALKTQSDESRATARRLREGAASKQVFAGLDPVCCPRCAGAFPSDRLKHEIEEGLCAVCDRDTLHDDQEALKEAIEAATNRADDLSVVERDLRAQHDIISTQIKEKIKERQTISERLDANEKNAATLHQRRALEDRITKIDGALEQLKRLVDQAKPALPKDDREKVLKAAEFIAEARMKSASLDLFLALESEVVSIARRFGFRGLESISIRGNGITLTVSGVASPYGRQTPGQKLRLRIALIMAMMRRAAISGFGHHPGLLFIDSPGSEELSDGDLLAMISEIGLVASETQNLQIFIVSARGNLLQPAFNPLRILLPTSAGSMF